MKGSKIILCAMLLLLPVYLIAQTTGANNDNLKGHSTIILNMGVKGNSSISTTNDISISEMKSGFTGGLEYGYWFQNDFQLGFKAGLVEASTNVNYIGVKSNAIISLLFGFKYYPESLKIGDMGRVYFGAYAGPFFGFATKEKGLPFVTENVNETIVGGEFLAGVDLFVARWFKFGPALNYNVMADFSNITGDKKNFSGFGFVFNFGFVL